MQMHKIIVTNALLSSFTSFENNVLYNIVQKDTKQITEKDTKVVLYQKE